MSSVFTDFVRQLEPGSPLDRELFEHLWQALRGALAVEMKRRSSWQTRPSFLGVVGHGAWVGGGGGSDGLDELVSDCFEFLFVRRRASLRRQAAAKPNIDGLVHLGVRQFLFETQSRNDPLGYHVFEVVRATVRQLVSGNTLCVLAGPSEIRNATLLGLESGVAVESCRDTELEPLIDHWIAAHLEALVTATHGSLAELRQRLGEELVEYLAEHDRGLRFGDLVAPLKVRVRRTWAARFLNLPGFMDPEGGELATTGPRGESLEEREHLADMVRCLEQSGEGAAAGKEREYFERLWSYIKAFVLESAAPPSLSPEGIDPGGEELPSQRKLAQFLGIPRSRFADLFGLLERRWKSCSDSVGAAATEVVMQGIVAEELVMEEVVMAAGHDDFGPRSPKGRALAAWRRAATQSVDEVVDETMDGGVARSLVAPDRLEAGDLFVVPGAEVDGVEWLLLGTDSGAPSCVPIDGMAILGRGDVDLGSTSRDASRRVARPTLAISPGDIELPGVWRTGRLDPASLESILEVPARRGETAQEAPEETLLELPSYDDWLAEGPALARERLLELGSSRALPRAGGPRAVPAAARKPPVARGRRPVAWMGLAAALLVSLGTSFHLVQQNRELGSLVEGLSAPIIDLPYREIQVTPTVRGPWLLEVPESATHVQLGVILVDLPPVSELRIELVRSSGEPIWETPPFSSRREISFTLPTHLLGDGLFELQVWGLGDGEWELLEQEAVQVIEPWR